MTHKMNEAQAMSLVVTDNMSVTIIPNSKHEYLMPTKDVATGYGVSDWTIRKHFKRNGLDFTEGKHYLKGGTICPTLKNTQPHQIFWTKRGIVRLGFFIRSERAKLFRDWAEDLVLAVAERKSMPVAASTPRHYRSNRLTPERVADLLSDVCMIENRELRERIASKITGGQHYGN